MVPNKYSYPYRIGLALSRLFGWWNILEVPFSKRELLKIATTVGFSDVYVYGFNYREAVGFLKLKDIIKYLIFKTPLGKYLKKMRGQSLKEANNIDVTRDAEYREGLLHPVTAWQTPYWDNTFGYALIMYGCKKT